MSTMKTREAVGPLVDLVLRRRAREQQHQIGVLGAARPDFLAGDDVVIAFAAGDGAYASSCRCRWSAR